MTRTFRRTASLNTDCSVRVGGIRHATQDFSETSLSEERASEQYRYECNHPGRPLAEIRACNPIGYQGRLRGLCVVRRVATSST